MYTKLVLMLASPSLVRIVYYKFNISNMLSYIRGIADFSAVRLKAFIELHPKSKVKVMVLSFSLSSTVKRCSGINTQEPMTSHGHYKSLLDMQW